MSKTLEDSIKAIVKHHETKETAVGYNTKPVITVTVTK